MPGSDLPGSDLPGLAQFAEQLRHRECSPLTVKNYVLDFLAFVGWFERTNGYTPTPNRATSTDLREFN